MSVGVCVINRNGIALAADSAATFTVNKMFYNSVNKVFKLSSKYPCGAIIYDNLSINNVSVEQIIKEFSVYLDSEDSLNDLYEIIALFEKFISEKYAYYKFDCDDVEPTKSLITALVNNWGKRINDVLSEDDGIGKAESIVKELQEKIDKSEKASGVSMRTYISNLYRSYYDEIITNSLKNLDIHANLKQVLWDNICDYFRLSLDREKHKTGVLFVGYGSNDAYPKFIEIEIRAVLGGTIKFLETKRYEAIDGGGRIHPVAQEEVVNTFCKGISQEYIDAIPQYVAESITNKISTLSNAFSDEQKKELEKVFAACASEVTDNIINMIRQKNIEPLMNSVMLISLHEMAFLAESLVNITSLKRTYSLDGFQQTVGGPTDVAIISKGDGFLWVKKK